MHLISLFCLILFISSHTCDAQTSIIDRFAPTIPPCWAGYMASGNTCVKCPQGLMSPATSTQCFTTCPIGTYRKDRYSQNECIPCYRGTYQDIPSAEIRNECKFCPMDADANIKLTPKEGATSKNQCYSINPAYAQPPTQPAIFKDAGYPHLTHGWFDIQELGKAWDYCRYVGNKPWFSCALAGAPREYTARDVLIENLFINFTKIRPLILPPATGSAKDFVKDKGYGDQTRLEVDLFGRGKAWDYCRMVGDYPNIWLSCAITGSTDEYYTQPGDVRIKAIRWFGDNTAVIASINETDFQFKEQTSHGMTRVASSIATIIMTLITMLAARW